MNRKLFLAHIRLSSSLGHSTHKIPEFRVFAVVIKKFSTVPTQYFKRENFMLLRDLVHSVPQESAFEGYGSHEYRSGFKNHFSKA